MTDSPRRETRSHGGKTRGNDSFTKRSNRNSSSPRASGEKRYGEKKFAGNRSVDKKQGEKKFGDKKFSDRRSGSTHKDYRGKQGHQRGGAKRREAREFAASTVRGEGYRPSKGVAPELDTDVTGKELDFGVQRELRALEKENAEQVAKHLVMAGRYLDIDPAFALEHAKYAVKRAGRISAVREAAGVTAYVAEDFEMSLRELRTHRRISGSNEHLALLIDNERALGRIDKALGMAEESAQLDLKPSERVEIALVVSGIHYDRGDLQEALKTLEIPQLNSKRGYDYSPRLFSAYADLLKEAGRVKEAARWNRLARMTEAALGQGDFAEPEIFDIFGEADLFEPEEPSVDLEAEAAAAETAQEKQDAAGAVTEEPVDDTAAEQVDEAGAGQEVQVGESSVQEAAAHEQNSDEL